jgi:hypothetical protein
MSASGNVDHLRSQLTTCNIQYVQIYYSSSALSNSLNCLTLVRGYRRYRHHRLAMVSPHWRRIPPAFSSMSPE